MAEAQDPVWEHAAEDGACRSRVKGKAGAGVEAEMRERTSRGERRSMAAGLSLGETAATGGGGE